MFNICEIRSSFEAYFDKRAGNLNDYELLLELVIGCDLYIIYMFYICRSSNRPPPS